MACAATYCLLYVYERVTWTAKAKHEAFRHQYMSYAASRLGMVTGIVTDHCSSQVDRYYICFVCSHAILFNNAGCIFQPGLHTIPRQIAHISSQCLGVPHFSLLNWYPHLLDQSYMHVILMLLVVFSVSRSTQHSAFIHFSSLLRCIV